MITTAVFDTKPYDREALPQASANCGIKWTSSTFASPKTRAVPQLLEKQGDTKLETRPELNALRDKCNEEKGAEQPWQPGLVEWPRRIRSVSAFLTVGKSFLTLR